MTGYSTDQYRRSRSSAGYRSNGYDAAGADAAYTNATGYEYAANGNGQWTDERSSDEDHDFGRGLFAAIVSVVLPGIGHAMAGYKRTGRVLLSASLLLFATLVIAYVGLGRARLIALTVDATALTWLAYGTLGLGVAWALVIVSAFLVNRPATMTPGQRGGATLLVGLLALTVLATGGLAAYYANTQRDLISTVFGGGHDGVPKKPNFFAHKPRVNIMLLGSDAAEDRTGVRTDTVIVASIDTKTGRTVLFSLPRNLQKIPFATGTPAAEEFADGFQGPGPVDNYLLNAVYKYGQDHPNLVPHAADPGAMLLQQAVEGTLDLKVDYYMMIDLKGFEGIVNALGGIKVIVKKENGRPIPIGGEHNADGSVKRMPKGSLPVGKVKLDGYQALWYARSRFYSDDYHRMARQQCVLGAIARQATPTAVLAGYRDLAKTAKKSIETDIPGDALESMVELAAQGKTAKITTISFDNKVIKTADPDYDLIHRKVQEALENAKRDVKRTPTPTTSAATATASSSSASAAATAQAAHSGTTKSAAPKPGDPVSVDDVCEYW